MYRPGAKIGRYQVVGPVGRGDPDGLFEVQDLAGRTFAMRSPIGDLEDDDAVTKRFGPVAEALRGLAHLNLVALLDVFIDGGQLYMIFERVGGRSLATAIPDGVSPRQALMIIRQALEGAATAHAMGRVHRDLRPSKLLLVSMGAWDLVKVADFGLGMMVDEVVLAFGAPALTGSLPSPAAAYMAPEQVLGRSVDPRTDIYSLGVILFELLAGRQPFPDSDPELVRRLQVTMPPPKLDEIARGADWCTPDVLILVETALAKEKEQRFQNAAAMIEAVDRAYRSIEHLPE